MAEAKDGRLTFSGEFDPATGDFGVKLVGPWTGRLVERLTRATVTAYHMKRRSDAAAGLGKREAKE